MAHEPSGGSDRTAIGFAYGLVAGAVVGAALGVLLAPKEGRALRRDIGERARALRDEARRLADEAANKSRRVGDVALEWVDRGKEVAERARMAASEGFREARRHASGPVQDPRSADLAGVEGVGENL